MHLLFCLFIAPLIAYDANGHLGHEVTLKCMLQTGNHNRGWFRITWSKLKFDGTILPLIHLPVRDKIPEWSGKISLDLRRRLQPLITVQPGHVAFNLKFKNLTCSDEAEYRCTAITQHGEIFANAELGIYAGPQKPHIQNRNMLIKSKEGHVTVECKADVGLPPRILVWYIKPVDTNYFMIMDKQRDIIQETDGCTIVSTRQVDMTLSTLDKYAKYRCGYPGYIDKDGLFDELNLDLQPSEIIEMGTQSKVAASCKEGKCKNTVDNSEYLEDDKNTSCSITISQLWTTIVICSYLFVL